ncbi:hypothetical protein F5I97DRAFT_1817834, partial [Phlebopus sp. FC_14]
LEAQLLNDSIRDELAKVRIGYALMCIADDSDLGRGPTLIRQLYNPRPINMAMIRKIQNDKLSNGLCNREEKYAIKVGLKRSYIKSGIINEIKNTYMFLLNGNHRTTFMKMEYELLIYKLSEYQHRKANNPNPHDLKEINKTIEDVQQTLINEATWLVEFYDIDALNEAKNSTLLYHHLSANYTRPAKDDTDTEKLKNLLRLMRNKSPDEQLKLQQTIAESWEKSKDNTSIRPAYIVNHTRLTQCLARIFTLETFEQSKFFSFFIQTFTPMMSILEYLTSPLQMPSIDSTSQRILGHVEDLLQNTDKRIKVVKTLEEEIQPQLQNLNAKPFMDILEAFDDDALLLKWDSIFSSTLSSKIHLLGSSEDSEITIYEKAYKEYFNQVIDATENTVRNATLNLSTADITRPVLINMVTKLQWIQLGFHPTVEPHITLSTPYPLFTELTLPAIMIPWNTKQISLEAKKTKNEEVDFGKTIAEDDIKQWQEKVGDSIWLDDFKQFLKTWKGELKESKVTPSIIRAKASNGAYAKMKTASMSKDRTEAFEWAYKVLRGTPIQWQTYTQNQMTNTFISAVVLAGQQAKHRHLLLELPVIWELRSTVLNLFEGYTKFAQTRRSFKEWDGYISPPQLSLDNHLLEYIPVDNEVESMGKFIERAAQAPQLEAQNLRTITKIIELARSSGLGEITTKDGRKKLDPTVNFALKQFITTLVSTSAKQVTRLRNPKANLTLPIASEEIVQVLTKLKLGSNFESLNAATDVEAHEYWRPRSDIELQGESSSTWTSTSTAAYNEQLQSDRARAALKIAQKTRQLQKAKLPALFKSSTLVDSDEIVDNTKKGK